MTQANYFETPVTVILNPRILEIGALRQRAEVLYQMGELEAAAALLIQVQAQ